MHKIWKETQRGSNVDYKVLSTFILMNYFNIKKLERNGQLDRDHNRGLQYGVKHIRTNKSSIREIIMHNYY